ncbi:MAG: motility-associated protein [Opitutales bacterium]
MLIIVGSVIVMASMLVGFMLAGGNPIVLLHVSEFVVIGGITIGVFVISTPIGVMKKLMADLLGSLKGGAVSSTEVDEMFKLLYELFMLGRRNGLLALDEHFSDTASSPIFNRYPTFMADHKRVSLLCNSMRPVIDGKIKPEQLSGLIESELKGIEEEAHETTGVLTLIGDSLPGIGIVAAVLGIINTMGSIADGPESVGYKVAAALTGTFLGIFAAYGFINPMNKALEFRYNVQHSFYKALAEAIVGFTRGLSPIMALEIARRALPEGLQMGPDELEDRLKAIGH